MSGRNGHRGLLLAGGVAEAASIYASLRSWWALDENAASPTYADSHGSHPMTARTGASTSDTNTVTTTTAIQGRAFLPNVTDNRCAYIPRSDTGLDLPNSNFSFGGWFRLGQVAATTAFVMGRVGSGGATIQAYLYILGADNKLYAGASSDGSTVVSTAGLANTIWSDAGYQFVMFTFNRTANQIEIRFSRSGYSSGALQKQTAAFASALYTTASAANFTICEGLSSDSTFYSSNRCGAYYADECLFIDKAITDDEFAYLYNGGTGRTYAQLVTDAG